VAQLIAITFEDQDSAGEALRRIRSLEKAGKIHLTDTAVLVKDEQGKLHQKHELDSGVETGAVVGGILGIALSFLFPVVGLIVGTAGGALVGRMLEQGVDTGLVKDVSAELRPGTSALFLMVDEMNADAAMAAIREFQGKGHVYQSSLPDEVEQELRRALGERVS
jgi:uncharacterized membrane protein